MIVVEFPKTNRLYLYTHIGGDELADIIRRALLRRRWKPDMFLARVLFDEMTCGETGGVNDFGISAEKWWVDRNPLVVNPKLQTITEENEDGGVLRSWGFEEFIAVSPVIFGHSDDPEQNSIYE